MSKLDEIRKRVEQYTCHELPGQPATTHMGTAYLIGDLSRLATGQEAELTQLRTEVQRSEEAARELWQKQVDQLRTERERLLEYLGRIRPLAKSIALISEADQDVKDMADSIWTITLAALTKREGGHR